MRGSSVRIASPRVPPARGRWQVLAQGRIGHRSKGGTSDLENDVAVDIRVDGSVRERQRDPRAMRVVDAPCGRVDPAGAIALTDGRPVPIELEGPRRVLGRHDEVGQGGSKTQLAAQG